MELTERQKEILLAIIKEFMEEASEVGSLALLEKYDLGVSSATIRNEMVKLMGFGLLEKSHISSGRLPTDQALRLYVSKFIDENGLNPLVSVEISQEIFRDRFSKETVIKAILRILSKETSTLAFMILDEDTRSYGLSNLLKYEEFSSNVKRIRTIVNIVEDDTFLRDLVEQYSSSGVSLLIGEESGIDNLGNCAMAFVKVPFWDLKSTYVGVIGTKRMEYSKVLSALREVRAALQKSMSGWR
jgi:transcriptional regulator of heat shock response